MLRQYEKSAIGDEEPLRAEMPLAGVFLIRMPDEKGPDGPEPAIVVEWLADEVDAQVAPGVAVVANVALCRR